MPSLMGGIIVRNDLLKLREKISLNKLIRMFHFNLGTCEPSYHSSNITRNEEVSRTLMHPNI